MAARKVMRDNERLMQLEKQKKQKRGRLAGSVCPGKHLL
jgi:hypothetical protein